MSDLGNSIVKPSFDEWLSSQTGTIDIDCGCVSTEAFYYWLRLAYEASSTATPDGWRLVPIELTDKMLLSGMIATEINPHRPVICRVETVWEHFLSAAPKPE